MFTKLMTLSLVVFTLITSIYTASVIASIPAMEKSLASSYTYKVQALKSPSRGLAQLNK